MEYDEYFLEIFANLPRAGPGSYECTRRAYALMAGLPSSPRMLDLGCGPGKQTVDLLRISDGTVLALDVLPHMIARTTANAECAGVAARLEVLTQDMAQMDFPADSFDVIWSEGAIYNLGFEAGLRSIQRFVRPGGFVAVSEAAWLKADPPAEAVEFWQQYPEMDSVTNKLAVIERLGYRNNGHFVLPKATWTDEYYDPMSDLIDSKAEQWAGIPEAQAVLDEARHEIDVFRRCSDYYSYVFFVMQRPEGEHSPR